MKIYQGTRGAWPETLLKFGINGPDLLFSYHYILEDDLEKFKLISKKIKNEKQSIRTFASA